MSYDFEDLPEGYIPPAMTAPRAPCAAPMRADDLELIVVCLELGALMLTNKPGDAFTFEQLVAKAHEMGDASGVKFDIRDARIVVDTASFLKKVPAGYVLR